MSHLAILAAAAAMCGLPSVRRGMREMYDDPKDRERREEEDRKRDEKKASRATYHERLMAKQRAEIARIEAMRAETLSTGSHHDGSTIVPNPAQRTPETAL